MIKQSRQIGRPGLSGKWTQPEGTSFYRVTVNGSSNFFSYLLYPDSFSVLGETVFYLKNGASYNAADTIVIIDNLQAVEASTAWGSSGASPRTEVRNLDTVNMTGPGEFTENSLLQESPNPCDPDTNLVSNTVVGGLMYINDNTGTPRLRFESASKDFGSGRTICTKSNKMSARVLLPTNAIRSIPAMNGYGSICTVTLLSET